MGYCPVSLQKGNGSICLQKHKPYNFLHRMPIEALCGAGARLLLLVGYQGYEGGGNVTSAGWQVTLCDPMWRVRSRSGVATLRTAIHLLLTYLPGESGSGEPPGLGQSPQPGPGTGPVPAVKSEATAIFAPQDGRWKITVSFDGRRFCVPKFRH